MAPKIKRQKRASPRIHYNTDVSFFISTTKHTAKIKDISQNGAFIYSLVFPKLESFINLELNLPNLGLQNIKAQVIWTSSDGFGVQFLEPSVQIIHEINALIIPEVEFD